MKKEIKLNFGGISGFFIISLALILSAGIFVGNITVFEALRCFFFVLGLIIGIPLIIAGFIILIIWWRD